MKKYIIDLMAITLILVLALILRLVLSNQSFWLDEAASVIIARQDISSLFLNIKADVHPPLFYLLLHYWLPIGEKSEWLIRLPNIILGTVSVYLTYLLIRYQDSANFGKSKFNPAIVSALFLAVNPLAIYYSQELRMYSLSLLLTLASWLCLFFHLKKRPKSFPILYIIISNLNLYTHYFAVFNSMAQLVYMMFIKKYKFLLYILMPFVFFLPWLPILSEQLVSGGYQAKALTGWSAISGSFSLKSLALIFIKFVLGRISLADKQLYLFLTVGLFLYFGLLIFLSFKVRLSRPFVFWLVISLALAVLLSFKSPVLGYWRFLFLLPPFLALVSIGLTGLPPFALYLNLSLIVLLFFLANLVFWFNPEFHRENWRQAARYIDQPDSLVIVNFTEAFAPLKFYLPQADYFPTQIKLGQIRPDLDEALTRKLLPQSSVFTLDYLSDLTDPQRQVSSWLKQTGFTPVSQVSFPGVGLISRYQTP